MTQTTSDSLGSMGMYRDAVQARYGAGDQYEVALKLMAAERHLTAMIGRVLREHDLTRPQWSVLTILHLSPVEQIPLGRIALALEVHGTTITNAVDRLAELGLVERVVDARDRRSVLATITSRGTEHADAILERLAEQRFGLASLRDSDLRTLSRVLGKLTPGS